MIVTIEGRRKGKESNREKEKEDKREEQSRGLIHVDQHQLHPRSTNLDELCIGKNAFAPDLPQNNQT
jgi:hypothetical protein